MYDNHFYGQGAQRYLDIMEQARKEYKIAKQKRTMATMADFATNLISLLGQRKGLRYNVSGTPRAPQATAESEKMRQYYLKTVLDYNGAIAADNLKNGNPAAVAIKEPPVPWQLQTAIPAAPMTFKKGYKESGSGLVLRDIRNIQTPVWHINNNKKQNI